MPLVTTGEISIGGTTANRSINLELGRAQNATSSLGETALRNLAGVPTGAISLSNFYGKSSFAYVNPILFAGSYTDYDPDAGYGSVSLTIQTDGQWSAASFAENLYWAGNWGTPTTAGVGTGKFVRFSVQGTSGSPVNTFWSTDDSWQELTANRTVIVSTAAPVGTSRIRTVTYLVEIATDSIGTNVVTSGQVILQASGRNNGGQ